MKTRIMFIISGLDVGGAQMMLYKLLTRLNRDLFAPEVVSLVANPMMIEKFRDAGIPVTNLALEKTLSGSRGLVTLLRVLRRNSPDIVQTWMYHADFLGGLCARITGHRPVIWNIRHSLLEKNIDKKSTILIARLCARLSSILPEKIVCCSEVAKDLHVELGYDPAKFIIIPNGFDTQRFSPDPEARHRLRTELGISPDKTLIGLVGRYHPQKGHGNFIKAAARLDQQCGNAEFLLCGHNIDWCNDELADMVERSGLAGKVHLLGVRDDIPQVTAALDIATNASSGEGFSNTIGEAMACGVPCVVTDVGDSAMIVGTTGTVVPPNNAEDLSRAWMDMICLGDAGRRDLGSQARERVIENFTLDQIVERYQQLYLQTATNFRSAA